MDQTDTPDTPAAAAAAAPEIDFASQLQGLLDKLVPPDEVEVQLVGGARVSLRCDPRTPTRSASSGWCASCWSCHKVQQGLQAGAGTSAVVELVVGMATDEQVAELLGRMFAEAYPDALPDGHDPLDALPLEELAVALVPSPSGSLQRLGKFGWCSRRWRAPTLQALEQALGALFCAGWTLDDLLA